MANEVVKMNREAVAEKSQERQLSITSFMTNANVQANIARCVAPNEKDRFVSAIISAVNANPNLARCSNGSILNAALLGYSLKLSHSPQLGQYYFVPYSHDGVLEAQFQLGYRGLIQLAIRSGYYRKINALAIKEGELISYDPLNEDIVVKLIDDPEARENAKTIGYYGMFEYTNGFRKCVYWSAAKMEAHKNRFAKAKNVWAANYEAMALKTVIRNLLSKWGVMSIDMQTAMDADESFIHEGGIFEKVEAEKAAARVDIGAVADMPVFTPESAPQSENNPENDKTPADDGKNAVRGRLGARKAPQKPDTESNESSGENKRSEEASELVTPNEDVDDTDAPF